MNRRLVTTAGAVAIGLALLTGCGEEEADTGSAGAGGGAPATTGSPGEAKGSLSMITHESCSPTTSTPCQNEAVASSTAPGVDRNASSRAGLGASPWISGCR